MTGTERLIVASRAPRCCSSLFTASTNKTGALNKLGDIRHFKPGFPEMKSKGEMPSAPFVEEFKYISQLSSLTPGIGSNTDMNSGSQSLDSISFNPSSFGDDGVVKLVGCNSALITLQLP